MAPATVRCAVFVFIVIGVGLTLQGCGDNDEAATIVAAEGTHAAATPNTTAVQNMSTAATQDPGKTEDIPNEDVLNEETMTNQLLPKTTGFTFKGSHTCLHCPTCSTTIMWAEDWSLFHWRGYSLAKCAKACWKNKDASPHCTGFDFQEHHEGQSYSICVAFTGTGKVEENRNSKAAYSSCYAISEEGNGYAAHPDGEP